MKKHSILLLSAGLACMPLLPAGLHAATSSRKTAPEPNNAWEWARQAKDQKKTPEDVMTYYRAHAAEFKTVSSEEPDRAVFTLFFLAHKAYQAKAVEFEELLSRARNVVEDFVNRRQSCFNGAGPSAPNDLLRSMVEAGEFDQALKLADWTQKVKTQYYANPDPKDILTAMHGPPDDSEQSMILRSLYKSVGDYASVEKLLRDRIQQQKAKSERMKAVVTPMDGSGMTSMFDALPSMYRPELANALARQGKMAEALQIVDEVQKSGGVVGKMRKSQMGKMMEGILGDVASANDGLQFAEIWLANGQAERALKTLENAQQKQESFLNRFNAGPTGKNRNFADYEKVTAAKVLRLKSLCLWQLGRVAEAVESQEQMLQITSHLSPDHPDMINARISQAWGWLALKKNAEAAKSAAEIAKDQNQAVAGIMRFASVRQRLIYLQQADPFSLLIATGQIPLLAEAVLRLKGVVLDSVLEEQRFARDSTNAEAKALIQELSRLRKDYSMIAARKAEDGEALRREIEATESRLAGLTSAKLAAREALTVTADQVKAALAEGDAVVEFIRYREMVKPGNWQPRYGALVIQPGRAVAWQPLGDSGEIDRFTDRFLNQIKGTAYAKTYAGLEQDLKTLHGRLLAPLEPLLGGARRLILAPDGNLGRLSLAVLLAPDGRFACERWELCYISSARDLLKPTSEEAGVAEMALFAAPDYNLDESGSAAAQSLRGMSFAFDRSQLPVFSLLESTRREMECVSRLLESQGIHVKTFVDKEAREEVLAGLAVSPRFLHLATHGFVLPATASINAAERGAGGGGIQEAAIASAMPMGPMAPAVSDNPLQRAVLALAGTNTTFAKWKAGEIPPTATDGVLTAAEVATLNLSNTWLAVLSACETGAGEALSGEGVMGMRRGFFLAGVDHLMMTFWNIADDETGQVMLDFYRLIGDKAHPATALHRVQRDALVKWRKEEGLQVAVFVAGPFALTTSGRLPPP